MAVEVRFVFWCDNEEAKHSPRTVEGDTIVVYQRSKKKLVDIDVCDSCLNSLTEPQIQDLALRFGREPKASSEDAKDRVCPLGCKESKPFRDRAGMRRHMTRKSQTDEAHARYLSEHMTEFA